MNKTTFILGVDVSKLTLDVHCAERNAHVQLSNNTEGFRLLHKWCRLHLIDLTDTMVTLEHTGGYEYKLLQHLQARAIPFVRIPGLAIKRSLGIVRGKNDRIDAARIARYGRINQPHLQQGALNEAILQLKELLGFRKRLVRDHTADQTTLGERLHTRHRGSKDLITHSLKQRIKSTEALIEKVQRAISALIEGCAELKQNYRLLTSIRGIGPVNAWMTLAYTENFRAFTDARRYAVYVGVVPFEHSSGTSMGGKKRVSHLANKELKAELEGAARAAMQWDPEMKNYAEGKKREGKHIRVIRNNVKFKLILRMFAVVKRGTNYVDKPITT